MLLARNQTLISSSGVWVRNNIRILWVGYVCVCVCVEEYHTMCFEGDVRFML